MIYRSCLGVSLINTERFGDQVMTSSRASSWGQWVCGRWGGGCRQACQADEGGADRRPGSPSFLEVQSPPDCQGASANGRLPGNREHELPPALATLIQPPLKQRADEGRTWSSLLYNGLTLSPSH